MECRVGKLQLPALSSQPTAPSVARILTGMWQQWPAWCRQQCWAGPGCGRRRGMVVGGSACSRTQLGTARAAGLLLAGLPWRPQKRRGSGCPCSVAAGRGRRRGVNNWPLPYGSPGRESQGFPSQEGTKAGGLGRQQRFLEAWAGQGCSCTLLGNAGPPLKGRCLPGCLHSPYKYWHSN